MTRSVPAHQFRPSEHVGAVASPVLVTRGQPRDARALRRPHADRVRKLLMSWLVSVMLLSALAGWNSIPGVAAPLGHSRPAQSNVLPTPGSPTPSEPGDKPSQLTSVNATREGAAGETASFGPTQSVTTNLVAVKLQQRELACRHRRA